MWTGNGLSMLPSLHGQMTEYNVADSTNSTTLEVKHTFPVDASDGLFIGKLSRKRNITDSHKDNVIYNDGSSSHGETFIYEASHIPHHAYSDHCAGRFHMGNLRGKIDVNQNSSFILQNSMLHQHDNHCAYDINKFPSASLTTWTKEVAKIENPVSSNFHKQDPSTSMSNSAVVEIPRSIYSQHFTYNVPNAAEVKNPQLNASGCDAYMGKNQANLSSLKGMSLQQVSNATPSPALITSSRSLISSEFSPQRAFSYEMLYHVRGLDQKNQRQMSCNDVITAAYAHNAAQLPTISASTACAAESQNLHGSSESQGRFFDGHPVNTVTSELHNGSMRYQAMTVMEENHLKFGRSDFHVSRDFYTNTSNTYSSSSGNMHSLVEENGFSKIGSPITKKSHEAQSLSSLNGEGNSHTGKSSSVTVGKLWDGTLQLNTSTTVSTLAFFRSGEKSTDIDWPQHVEVKGKVRLEAFEKFIQELPRSRNRGLMVISLCWRIGSSESGLTGLKEVAIGYKEGQRVGYAQLCSGIDLYVCPRCETIITILAKYGFFKGMTAVEEDKDSLIGCVVWRRNRTPLSSTLKKSEANNSPLEKSEKSSSNFAIQNAEPNSTEIKELYGEHIQNINNEQGTEGSGNSTFQTQLGFIENTGNWHEKKIFFSGISSATAGNLKFETSESAAPSGQLNPSVISMQFPEPHYSKSSSSQTLVEQRLDHEIPTSMTPDTGCAPMPPSTTHGVKNIAAVDDDLPEFDFGNTRGDHQLVASRYRPSSHQEDLSANSHKIQVEEGKTRLSTPPAQPPLPPGPPPSHVSRQMDPTTFQGSSYFIHSLPISASIAGEHVSKCGSTEQSHETSGEPVTLGDNALPTIASKFEFQRKNIWDDDDDMPEWCPPDMERKDHQRAPPPLPLPLRQSQPLTQPPLPPYPRPPVRVVSGPRSPPIPQETPAIASSWPSRAPSSQFLDYPPNNQGHTPADKAGLLGPGPQNSNAKLPMKTRQVSGNFQSDVRPPANHHDETSGSQSSRFEAKPYRRSSPARNSDRTTRNWHSGFDQENDDSCYFGRSQNESLRYRSTGFDPKPGQDWSPRRKHDETSKRRRTGFDVPDHRYSPGLSSKHHPDHRSPPISSPKQSSRRRRPSLFDVKPQLSNKYWRR